MTKSRERGGHAHRVFTLNLHLFKLLAPASNFFVKLQSVGHAFTLVAEYWEAAGMYGHWCRVKRYVRCFRSYGKEELELLSHHEKRRSRAVSFGYQTGLGEVHGSKIVCGWQFPSFTQERPSHLRPVEITCIECRQTSLYRLKLVMTALAQKCFFPC